MTDCELALVYLGGKPTPLVVPGTARRLGLTPLAVIRTAFGVGYRQHLLHSQRKCACLDCAWTVGEA